MCLECRYDLVVKFNSYFCTFNSRVPAASLRLPYSSQLLQLITLVYFVMLKRPASSHTLRAAILKKPAMERKCWSCMAGGFGKWSSAAQSNLDQRGCCGSCASNRTCMCGAFNEDRSAIWCTGCHQHLAKWCWKCEMPGDLDSQLCGQCRDRGVMGKADSTEKNSARLDGVC